MAFGIGIFLKLIGPAKLVDVQFGASVILAPMAEQQLAIVAVNLYALFALMYLVRERKMTNEQSAPAAS